MCNFNKLSNNHDVTNLGQKKRLKEKKERNRKKRKIRVAVGNPNHALPYTSRTPSPLSYWETGGEEGHFPGSYLTCFKRTACPDHLDFVDQSG